MTYPKQLMRLRPTHGLAFDLPPVEVGPDFFTEATNINFRNGFAQRIGGSRQAYDQNTLDPVYHLLNVRAPGGVTGSNFWLAFGLDDVHALETSNTDDVTGAALTPVTSPWEWHTTLINNFPVFTNGLDVPRYWGGDVGTPFAALPGWPASTTCKSIAAFKFHLFALDIDGPSGHFESQILWSDAAPVGTVPSTWTAAATNEAGDAVLADTPGPCMCAVPLQDTLLVFKRSGTYSITYVGPPNIFEVRLLDGVRGALTRHAAVDIGGRVFVVCDGDIVITDGISWRSIAQGRVKNYLFSQLDQSSYENLYAVYHRSKNEVWLAFPVTGETFCSEVLIYSVATDSWGVRSITANTFAAVGTVNDLSPDESWDSDSEAWDLDGSYWNSANFSLAVEQLLTSADSDVLTLQDDDTATDVAATIIRNDLTMGEPERFKFVKRVHVRTSSNPGTLYVRVGARNAPTESITWGSEQTFTAGSDWVNVRAQGKLISVSVRGEDDSVWVVTGIDLEYELRGYV
jgi:hypothetical protein